jgi:hypothetical protein
MRGPQVCTAVTACSSNPSPRAVFVLNVEFINEALLRAEFVKLVSGHGFSSINESAQFTDQLPSGLLSVMFVHLFPTAN